VQHVIILQVIVHPVI